MARKRQRTLSLVDYDGQQGVIEFQMPLSEFPLVENVQWAALKDAIMDITLGTQSRETNTYYEQLVSSGTKSAIATAQRQVKWLVSYEDTTEFLDSPTNAIPNPNFRRIFNTEIPTAKLALRTDNNEVVYSGGGIGTVDVEFAGFIQAFEAIVRSPSGGAIRIVQIKSHSRNV